MAAVAVLIETPQVSPAPPRLVDLALFPERSLEERYFHEPSIANPARWRRFAASMLLSALRALQPLLNSRRTDLQYFESVEALVWLSSEGSERYFDAVGLDPERARQRIDLSLYAELALTVYQDHRRWMLREYTMMARYTLQEKQKRIGKKVPHAKMVEFAEAALAYSTVILEQLRDSAPPSDPLRRPNLAALLEVLDETVGTA